jgi:hypothetical protein
MLWPSPKLILGQTLGSMHSLAIAGGILQKAGLIARTRRNKHCAQKQSGSRCGDSYGSLHRQTKERQGQGE